MWRERQEVYTKIFTDKNVNTEEKRDFSRQLLLNGFVLRREVSTYSEFH